MATTLKPARLWLRPARGTRKAVYIIKYKGGLQKHTGCGADNRKGAEDALAAHIAATHRPEKPKSDNPADIAVGDVLTLYMRDKTVASPAELGQRPLGQLADVVGRGNVGPDREHATRGAGQPIRADGERVIVDVGNDHVQAGPRELLAQRESDPGRPAGDDCDLSRLELHERGPFRFRCAAQAARGDRRDHRTGARCSWPA